MNLIIMGPQGSGKSTQGDLLAEKLGIPHIQTGGIFREITKQDTDLGRMVKALIDNGNLVDDETTYRVLDQAIAPLKSGFILDGFPRTLAQAKRESFPVDKVIYVRLTDEEGIKRITSRAAIENRADDTPEAVAKRLQIYHQSTEPILDYYRQQGKLIEVDGSGTIEEVRDLIFAALAINGKS
jgi:adenylate kinase